MFKSCKQITCEVCLHLLMKQLIPCFRIRSTFSFIFSFSASSISATFAVESTRTLEPKIWHKHTLILQSNTNRSCKNTKLWIPPTWESASPQGSRKRQVEHELRLCTLILSVSMPVLAIRILTFSILFGWFTPIFLSNRNPVHRPNTHQSETRGQSGWGRVQLLWRVHAVTFVQIGVCEASSQLLDDVNGLQVPGALQPHHGVDGQLGEVIFVVSQQFGRQRGPGDVQQVLLETSCVVAMETARTTDKVTVWTSSLRH